MFELQHPHSYSTNTPSTSTKVFVPNIAPISSKSNENSNSNSNVLSSSSPCSSTDSYDSTLSNSPNSSNSSNCSHNSNSSNASMSSASSSAPIGVNLRVTGQCSQGGRKYMEDYFSVAYQQSENAKDLEYAFIGIFDGHGGAEAAIYAKEHLMMEIIKQKQFWSENDHDVLRAIREGYIATHYAMWRDQENWPKTSNGLPSTAGTTATIAFIRREKIYIGHVGDSGIVLGYQNEFEDHWRAKQLTTDHKPESVQERSRIKRAGGKVMVKSGVPRVVWRRPRDPAHVGPIRCTTVVDEIPFLAVARSLGDLWSYNPENREFIVSPDPDVKVVKINPKTFRCLIFGTDGLWNVVSPQEAVNKVHERECINQRLQVLRYDNNYDEKELHWTNPSKGLVEDALKTWSAKKMRADNTSVVTVILYPATEQNTFSDADTQTPLPISYGLEYTEVQADAPVYDDPVSYKELAQKYLPPEAYRNFNYYQRETGGVSHTFEVQDVVEDVAVNDVYPLHMHVGPTITKVPGSMKTANATDCNEDDDDDDEDEDDANENEEENENENDDVEGEGDVSDDEVDVEEDAIDADDDNDLEEGPVNDFISERRSLPAFAHWDPATHKSYLSDHSRDYDIIDHHVRNDDERADDVDALGKYDDIGLSFAETFNSLLAEQEVTQPQQTNTVKTTTTTYASMQDILEEQACLSEQEGYSLTKLETRQEKQQQQQHEKKVQENATLADTSIASDQPSSSAAITSNNCTQNSYWSTTRYQLQQLEDLAERQQKLLGINALLQQEHEIEQQVLVERFELERLKVQENADNDETVEQLKLGAEQGREVEKVDVEQQKEIQVNAEEWSTVTTADETLMEEYLEDDEVAAVQINEISSSNMTETNILTAAEYANDTICSSSKEVPTNCNTSMCTPQTIELLERVELLQPIVDSEDFNPSLTAKILAVKTETKPKSSTNNSLSLSLKRTISKLQCYPNTLSSPAKRLRTRSFYPNIPNENQRLSITASSHSLKRMHRQAPSLFNNASYTIIQHEKRQLRSNTSNLCLTNNVAGSNNIGIEYSKRTLRTRNTLAKDLKAKSSFVTTPKHTAATLTKQFLRQNAGSLLGDDKCCRVTSKTKLNATTTSAELPNSISKLLITKPAVLNLRSRQIEPTTNRTSMSTLNQRVNRNLRSAAIHQEHKQNESQKPLLSTITTIKITPTSYSKTTKLQTSGSGSIAVAPPPSPKIFNFAPAISAANTATRTRSIIAAKANQAVAAGTSAKRFTLRNRSSVTRIADDALNSHYDNSSRSTAGSTSTINTNVRARLTRKR